MKIAIAGTGYVGLSMATLLAQHNSVTAVDVIPQKVEMINRGESPINDDYIQEYLSGKDLDLKATLDGAEAYRDAAFVVIATPTDYDPQRNFFNTSSVEAVIDLVLSVNPNAVMVIKSTVPVGYCRSLYDKYGTGLNLLFSPEFLRESKALYDNLYPSRIIVGYPKEQRHAFLGEYNLPGIDSYLGLLVQSLFDPSPSQVISGIREKNMERLRFSLRIATQEIRDRAQSTGG